MKRKKKIIIPFVGLKEGSHKLDFEIGKSFFQEFEYSIIENADFLIEVDLLKQKTLIELNLNFKGLIYSECYRCGEPLELKVKGKNHLIVKFGDLDQNASEEILVLPDGSHEIDLTESIYELTNLLMPPKPMHKKEKDCNQKVIEVLNSYSIKNAQEGDPRWEALSNLKNKN